ncbi:CAP domain-containing protein [Aquabacterium sp. J223]|uniref:CAP domain-containing protein n=1 Tax=Aquabacterium sp. J223 TaxID=2898431 RepID=UPI0021ADB423|nr:CAP domain-containing protein [Aquabacterium sp. J223]UUX96045.1 CAP domain-containing protein [Aquabacterium sp. J223]
MAHRAAPKRTPTVAALVAALSIALPDAAPAQGRPRACAGDPAVWLSQLNAWRAQPQPCGAGSVAAPPLQADARLQDSAQAQALAIAERDDLSHQDQRGQTLAERLRERGIVVRQAGEAVAGGQDLFQGVLERWRDSPAHCAIAADPRFAGGGIACAEREGSRYGRFWVLQAGTTRR